MLFISNLFLLIFLLTPILFIIGMIKPDLIEKITKKEMGRVKITIICLGILLVSFIGFGMTSDAVDSEEDNIATEEVDKIDDQEEEKKEEAKKEKQEKQKEPEYEIVENVAIFTDDDDTILSPKSHVRSFSTGMTQKLKENHKNIENGAIFTSAKPLIDDYGNEEKKYILTVWYSQETIEKLNFDNWPMNVGEDLYKTADAMWVHPAFRKDGEIGPIMNENIPGVYNEYLGTKYKD